MASVSTIVLGLLSVVGCSSPSDPETTIRSEPLEVRCRAEKRSDGRTVVRYQARNIGQKTVYIADGRRMPYELIRDGVLLVLHGVNAPEPNVIYEITEVPRTKPLLPGEIFRGEAALGKTEIRNHFYGSLTPAKFLHGKVRVACVIGWGETPIADPRHTRFDEFMSWQRTTNFASFEVVLP